jgi:hypothetical protein
MCITSHQWPYLTTCIPGGYFRFILGQGVSSDLPDFLGPSTKNCDYDDFNFAVLSDCGKEPIPGPNPITFEILLNRKCCEHQYMKMLL